MESIGPLAILWRSAGTGRKFVVRSKSDTTESKITIESSQFLRDVLDGLGHAQKRIPSKYLYDTRGSELFAEICEVDEYYVTRTEMAILEDNAPAMAERIGAHAVVIEPGAGNVTKVGTLLDALDEPQAFMAIDVSFDHLREGMAQLEMNYPDVQMIPVEGDFTQHFTVPDLESDIGRRCLFFPGSTIGNFTPAEQLGILRSFGDVVEADGVMLIGIDLIKSRSTLEAAYDDAKGVTAEFNRNVLRRVEREFDATVDPDSFEHEARFDDAHNRIEMHLVSQVEQTLEIESEAFEMQEGESILTEYSHKFELGAFTKMAGDAGLEVVTSWTDQDENFALVMLEPQERDYALPR